MLGLLYGSCANIYNDMVDKTTESAKLYQAEMYLSSGQWTAAITQFNLLNATTLATTSVKVDYASAYAGRCGLNFLNMANTLQNQGAQNLLEALLPAVVTSSIASVQDCVTAETILMTMANANCVVSDPNGALLIAFSSLAKISSILNFYADANKNGTVDAGWDACGGAGLANLPNADLDKIVTAFYIFINNAAGLSVGGGVGVAMLATCEAALGVGNCNKCTAAAVTNNDRWLMRGMIVETTDGIGLKVRGGSSVVNAANPACQL